MSARVSRRPERRATLLAGVALCLFTACTTPASTPDLIGLPQADKHDLRLVLRVVDGDTVVVESRDPEVGAVTVRLIGIDTPERGQPGYAEARDYLRSLVHGKRVRLEREAGHANRDRYGRLLRLVYVDGQLAQVALIRAGHSRYEDRWGRCPTIERSN